MGYPTIVEAYGSLSATGLAEEVTFGTAVAATSFQPMTGNTMTSDPGWFSPMLMQGFSPTKDGTSAFGNLTCSFDEYICKCNLRLKCIAKNDPKPN